MTQYSSSVIDPVLNGFVSGKSLTAIVTAEIWHHRTCTRDLSAKPPKETDGFSKERNEVFQRLLKYIQTNVIDIGQLLSLSATLNYYKTLQESYEMEVKVCIAKNLKGRLSNHFKLQIDFLKTSKGIEFIYCPETIDIITNSEPSKEKLFYDTEKVAKKIRTEIENMDNSYASWPSNASELFQKGSVPELLSHLLSSILVKEGGKKTSTVLTLINSIGQDIIHSLSMGQKKTKKHAALGLCLKRKTESKDILTWLNRLGHCIFCDEVNRIETYLAEIESKNNENENFIPSNINPSSFVSFVADNGDHNPESLNGKSLQCTNMIMLQPQEPNHISINEEPAIMFDVTYQRKRSFKPISMDIRKYQPVKRTTPAKLNQFKESKIW